jgi:hypothetical protein
VKLGETTPTEHCVNGAGGFTLSQLVCKIDAKEKVVVFMAEHAAYVQNRLEVGADGKTA